MATEIYWLILVISHFLSAKSKYVSYDTTSTIVPGKINVHLVPHSHDDVGWLKTVDQYYVGSNNSIQGACMQNVLDSVMQALLVNNNRKFIIVEQAFFQRWWREQSSIVQSTVKKLVQSKQLEFVNGGMCMHDEATTHYIDMIDQTTLGHYFLKGEFNITPRIGWQIDPFGHSTVQAYLLGAKAGFDALYFARIDYQDREKRKKDKNSEFIWQASESLGSSAQIFAGAFYQGNYEPPSSNFNFEVNTASVPIQDDSDLYDYNVPERVNEFVAAAFSQVNVTRTNHIMWTMGTDFAFQYATSWYRQMDKLIHYVNLDGRVNALYSTPSMYTDAKYSSENSWMVKVDDFFPYADKPHAYWTGYFASRPAFKHYVRWMSAYYMVARQLEFFAGWIKVGHCTELLADALAVAQHHDAVSGTEKQHVADDYAKRISIGYSKAEEVVIGSLSWLVGLKPNIGCTVPETSFQQCNLLNISYCEASEAGLLDNEDLVILLYNPTGWRRHEFIRIPILSNNVAVRDFNGKEIGFQLSPFLNDSLNLREFYLKAHLGKSTSVLPHYWLIFSATVPALGFSTYFVSHTNQSAPISVIETCNTGKHENDVIELTKGNLKLIFSRKDGKLIHYINSRYQVGACLEQSYAFYAGDDGTKDEQAAGAYIFRPNGSYPIKNEGPLTVIRGSLMDEIHQKFNSWIYQITRIYKDKEHVEFEFMIGPIPINDGIGKEIVTRLKTSLRNNGTFYTDSNGRDFIKRVRDYRTDWDLEISEPIAGNYYPVNLGIFMKDNKYELSVLVDRSVGGSSIIDGQLELMLHRRLLHDDQRGVGEALNETVCVQNDCQGLSITGKYYIRLDSVGHAARWRRSFGQQIYSPLLLAFSVQDRNEWEKSHLQTFSAMHSSYVLPDNVAIVTLQELDSGQVLLRLAHLYQVGEDGDLSRMAQVELKKLFPTKRILKVVETSLTANQDRTEMEQKRLEWRAEGHSGLPKMPMGGHVDPSKLVVELAPMEIRTFLVHFFSVSEK